MHPIEIVQYVYAAILAVGGVIGYAKAKSPASLASGTGSAILAAVAGALIQHHPRLGLGVGCLISFVLAVFFFRRYQITKKAMPPIPMTVISAIVLIGDLTFLYMAAGRH